MLLKNLLELGHKTTSTIVLIRTTATEIMGLKITKLRLAHCWMLSYKDNTVMPRKIGDSRRKEGQNIKETN